MYPADSYSAFHLRFLQLRTFLRYFFRCMTGEPGQDSGLMPHKFSYSMIHLWPLTDTHPSLHRLHIKPLPLDYTAWFTYIHTYFSWKFRKSGDKWKLWKHPSVITLEGMEIWFLTCVYDNMINSEREADLPFFNIIIACPIRILIYDPHACDKRVQEPQKGTGDAASDTPIR